MELRGRISPLLVPFLFVGSCDLAALFHPQNNLLHMLELSMRGQSRSVHSLAKNALHVPKSVIQGSDVEIPWCHAFVDSVEEPAALLGPLFVPVFHKVDEILDSCSHEVLVEPLRDVAQK